MTISYVTSDSCGHGDTLEGLLHQVRQAKYMLDKQTTGPVGKQSVGWKDPVFDPKVCRESYARDSSATGSVFALTCPAHTR
jgi:hypothetical protein